MSIPILSTLELGLIYSLVSLGVYLTFRVIHFPDLTVDGSFPLGAAVVAILLTKGCSPPTATLTAVFAGMLAGSITGFLSSYLRVMGLFAGILTMIALYSINIRIMGKPNIALLDIPTLFSGIYSEFSVILGIVLFLYLSIYCFMKSQYGLALRASGMNPTMSQSYGVNTKIMTLVALAMSNGCVALAGALFAQSQGFSDVSLGTGTIITGLASVMIGESIFSNDKLQFGLLGCFVGSILYRIAIAVALNIQILGLQPSDLNLITAVIVVLALMMKRKRMLSHDRI